MKTEIFFRKAQTPCGKGGIRYLGPFGTKKVSDNKYPPAKPEVFHFRAVSPNTTSSAQVALMTTWQSCDCYLPPVNGPFLCLTFFSYAFAPLFLFLISIFPFTFLSLLFLLFLPFFLSPFLLLVFCSSAKPLLNPRTIRGFSYTKRKNAV